MKKIAKILQRASMMGKTAYIITKWSLILSIFYLAAAVGVLAAANMSPYTYELYAMAKYLYTVPQAILLVAVLGSVCIEDASVTK